MHKMWTPLRNFGPSKISLLQSRLVILRVVSRAILHEILRYVSWHKRKFTVGKGSMRTEAFSFLVVSFIINNPEGCPRGGFSHPRKRKMERRSVLPC